MYSELQAKNSKKAEVKRLASLLDNAKDEEKAAVCRLTKHVEVYQIQHFWVCKIWWIQGTGRFDRDLECYTENTAPVILMAHLGSHALVITREFYRLSRLLMSDMHLLITRLCHWLSLNYRYTHDFVSLGKSQIDIAHHSSLNFPCHVPQSNALCPRRSAIWLVCRSQARAIL